MTHTEAITAIKKQCYFANLKDEAKEALDMAIKSLSEPTIPLSVIEKIKAQLTEYKGYCSYARSKDDFFNAGREKALTDALDLIDQAIKECDT